ncbi:phage holin family protein [Aquimarina intermedia]|uniref:Putative superfamily III holin-X n=1 Tax=Aquimarina intermedia TaxID=350814 RepID=A0A5S5CCM2_9FLAO|nr:phage holin family protein [Aquimarina intermedia]TYP76909.1 putative superfamily III holin-X [Aquimarina intermedia]
MAFENLTDNVKEIDKNVRSYVETSIEYYKLDLFKKTMKSTISLANTLVMGSLLMLILIFLSVGASIWIGQAINHLPAGYFIVAGFYAIVMALLAIFGKSYFKKRLLIKYSRIFFND